MTLSEKRENSRKKKLLKILYLSQQLMVLKLFVMGSGHANAQDISDKAYEYYFDNSLLRGERLSPSLIGRLNKSQLIDPGVYKLDIYLNGGYVERSSVYLKGSDGGSVDACLTPELMLRLGVMIDKLSGYNGCNYSEVSSSNVDINKLRLNINIPQSLIKRTPRGYVNPSDLDEGASVGFVNYLGNYYHVDYRGAGAEPQDSVYVSMNGGVNIGMWQYRQQSSLNWDKTGGDSFNSLRNYFQRAVPSIESQLTLGQTFTTGRLFSGLSYTGINLSSDERMLPDSQRGYAPTVRGISNTNAKVSIRQNGQEIYQVTVPPGPFEINDLYPTSYSGDLYVEVTEADGSINRFTVPFSAVPESLRPGVWRYGLSFGRTRDVGADAIFADATFQYGITNAITSNSGLRLSEGYQSATFGGVYSSMIGAFGFDTTYSRADLPNTGYLDGWMAHLSYSKTFEPTNTSIYIAGYRYSTAGYRDLSDVLGVRDSQRDGYVWRSTTYQQLSRFELTLNQKLNRYGNIYVSGSSQNFRGGRARDTQLQAGYGHALSNGISFNLNVSKRRIGGYEGQFSNVNDFEDSHSPGSSYLSGGDFGRTDVITSMSVSIPLGSGLTKGTSLSSTYTHSKYDGSQYQTGISGFSGSDQTLSYSAGLSHVEKQKQTVWNGSIQKRLPTSSLGASASRGDNYWQASANAQGALVVHSGGVTFGPYLGDTFALVEAKGASGAYLMNGQGAVIDNNGYALVPAVTPYRYSNIAINPEGMANDVELVDGEQRVAPYAGAAVKVTFRTRSGQALLIKATGKDGFVIPMGADAFDSNGENIGMVGQGGMVYVRTQGGNENIELKWGEEQDERCTLKYNVGSKITQPILKINATCE